MHAAREVETVEDVAVLPPHLESLNADQRAAATHGVDATRRIGPPLLIIAGAGSGKTNTLAHRVAHLILHGADPERILLLTFSRRAALEMQRRVTRVVQDALRRSGARAAPHLPWAGTFHSVGARLLREYAPRIGLDPHFTVQDRGDSEDLMGLVRNDLRLGSTAQRFPGKATCLAIYSRCVNSTAALPDVLDTAFGWCAMWEKELRALFAAYVETKQAHNVLDFDDLLLYWSQMTKEGAFAAEIGARFDHVLVDEYQDTNRLQGAILLALKPGGAGVTVVGDDAQAIYSFRAAEVRNILDFPQAFEPQATIITLERNYRSTRAILDASNAVMEAARERYAKALRTERVSPHLPELVTVADETAQAQFVAENILALREGGATLKSQAVLFRSGSHAAQLELELTRRRIPYVKYGGLRFLEAAHVKDVLSLLRFAQNPRGRVAGFRALQLVPGVGPATATKILERLAAAADPSGALQTCELPAATGEAWQRFTELFVALARSDGVWPAPIDQVLDWYAPQLERLYDDARIRRADLEALQAIASTYGSCERFLTELTLDPPAAVSDEAGPPGQDEDYVVLSTIHSAKGQEWKTVHVLNVVDGCMPSDMATATSAEIEEERRLLYVAMTRARDHLFLLVPQRFYVHQQPGNGDRHVYASRSRFLPETVLHHFTRRAWPPRSAAQRPPHQVTEAGPVIDLAARLRSAWR